MRLNHILVPTDLGESSQEAESLAVELAKTVKAKVTLLHVWTVPAAAYAEALTWPIDELEATAQKALDATVERLRARHPDVDGMLMSGLTWERILATAKELDVDMIVMGTHGWRGLTHFFLGSVAEKLVRLSPIPVLTAGRSHAPDAH